MSAALATVLGAGLVAAAVVPGPVQTGGPGRTAPVRQPDLTPSAGAATGAAVDPGFTLVEVSGRASDLEDGLAERVAFCFSRPVRTAGQPAGLVLLGPDVDTEVAATEVDLLVSDDHCVLGGFPPGTPVARYTVALAEQRAVADLDSASVLSTVPVAGAPPQVAVVDGGTSSPDLVAVRVDPTLDRIAFVYDEPLLQPSAATPGDFGYALPSGAMRSGDEVLDIAGNTVVVSFARTGIDSAVRASAVAGAVRGRDGRASPPGVKALRTDRTAAPELRSVEPAPDSDVLFDFTFDAAVEQAQPQRFALYRADATPLRGTAVVRPDPKTVRVLIPDARDVRPVLAAADAAAVVDLGGARANPLGIARLGPYGSEPGRTTGPDLLRARLDADRATLRLLFDQVLDREGEVDPAGIWLVLPSGRQVSAETFVQVRGRELLVLVSPTAAAAAGRVVVRRGAVLGANDERSAPGSRPLAR